MDKIDLEKMDFSDPENPKGLLDLFHKALVPEKIQAVASAVAIAEFQKGNPLSDSEKNIILKSVDNTVDEMLRNNLIAAYGHRISQNF